MNLFNVLVVDDEPISHKIIEDYCKEINDLQIVANCFDGTSAIEYLKNNKVDILLLDIQLPDIKGWEIFKEIDLSRIVVIFITAFDNYALQSFEYDEVIDYLHKPFRFSRFEHSIERARRIIRTNLTLDALQNNEDLIHNTFDKGNEITFNKGHKVISIKYADMLYMQAWGNYIKIFLVSGQIELIRKTFAVMEGESDPFGFVRIHKSFIVNKSFIERVIDGGIKVQDCILPIGRHYLVKVRKVLDHI